MPKNLRFACEASHAISGRVDCRFCPITKATGCGAFICCNGLYDDYLTAYGHRDYDLVASIAE